MAKRAKANATSPMDFVKSMCEMAEQKSGAEKVYVMKEHEKREWGLPIPWLSLQWLLHSNVFLLQKVWGAAGPAHSCKSAFLFELFRIHAMYGGIGALVETEGSKFSHELFKAVVGEYDSRIMFQRVSSIDEAQDAVTNILKFIKAKSKKKDQIAMVGLDSLTGTLGKEMQGKIDTEGHAGRSFPEVALKYAPYFQWLADTLVGWPISTVFTNHRKQDMDGGADRTPGGSSQDFHASVYLWIDRISNDRPKADGSEGRTIRFRTKKNSYGPNERRIICEFKWWWEVDKKTGKRNQKARWDWDASTAIMLCHPKLGVSGMKTKIADIIDLKVDGTRFSSKLLGMKEVTAHEIGVAIHNSPDLMRDLGDALNIHQYLPYGDLECIQAVTDEESAKQAEVPEIADYTPGKADGIDL